jgi:hypothetical protein
VKRVITRNALVNPSANISYDGAVFNLILDVHLLLIYFVLPANDFSISDLVQLTVLA